MRAHLKQNVTAIVQGNKNITELISCMQTNKAQADNACEDLLLFCLVLQIVFTLAGRLRMTFLLSFFFLVCLFTILIMQRKNAWCHIVENVFFFF